MEIKFQCLHFPENHEIYEDRKKTNQASRTAYFADVNKSMRRMATRLTSVEGSGSTSTSWGLGSFTSSFVTLVPHS